MLEGALYGNIGVDACANERLLAADVVRSDVRLVRRNMSSPGIHGPVDWTTTPGQLRGDAGTPSRGYKNQLAVHVVSVISHGVLILCHRHIKGPPCPVQIPVNNLKCTSEDRHGHSIPTICKYYMAIWLETGSSQRQWPSAIVYGSPWICSRALGGTRGTRDLPDSTACL